VYSRRARHRHISIIALLAMVASLVVAPFAQAHALRLAAVGQDLCSAASSASPPPRAPVHHGHATHAVQCECCTGSASASAPPPVIAAVLSLDVPRLPASTPRSVLVRETRSLRGGQPRAPPILA